MEAPISGSFPFYDELYPFTWTRPVGGIRVGILTLAEKWERLLPPGVEVPAGLPGNIVADRVLARMVMEGAGVEEIAAAGKAIRYPWEIFQFNEAAIADDFELLTAGRQSQPIPARVQVTEPSRVFIEQGAVLEHAILNASAGPIYIGPGVTIMDGAIIRGPFAAGEGTVVKAGAKIYGATTAGPYCTVGGEIKNSVLFGYTNKAHDGYLGDSVLGEWCNLGAGCSNSNVKNNAGTVKVWHQATGGVLPTGLKCGLLMGDYSRAAINTSFNTGTVVGAAANVFGEGLTPTHIPSFSWGSRGDRRYRFEEAMTHIANWKKLKNHRLTEAEIQTLGYIFGKL